MGTNASLNENLFFLVVHPSAKVLVYQRCVALILNCCSANILPRGK